MYVMSVSGYYDGRLRWLKGVFKLSYLCGERRISWDGAGWVQVKYVKSVGLMVDKLILNKYMISVSREKVDCRISVRQMYECRVSLGWSYTNRDEWVESSPSFSHIYRLPCSIKYYKNSLITYKTMNVVCWDMMSIGERRSTLQDEYYMSVEQVE